MSEWAAMIPAAVEGKARKSKRLGFAFGYRFLLLLLIGLGWLAPAFVSHHFVYAMLVWDLVLITAWAADLFSLPKADQLLIRRSWDAPLALSVRSQAIITVTNESKSTLHIQLLDALPWSLGTEPLQLQMTVPPRGKAEATYPVQPSRIGNATASVVYARYEGVFRLAQRWAMAELTQELTV